MPQIPCRKLYIAGRPMSKGPAVLIRIDEVSQSTSGTTCWEGKIIAPENEVVNDILEAVFDEYHQEVFTAVDDDDAIVLWPTYRRDIA